MDAPRISTSERSRSNLIIGIFFYLSAIEFAITLWSYLRLYQKYNWWNHPTTAGKIILISLGLAIVFCSWLGYYYQSHPQKAAALSHRLTRTYSYVILFIFLIFALASLIIILFNLANAFSDLVRIRLKLPYLISLATLLDIQAIFTLVALHSKYLDEPISLLYRKYVKTKETTKIHGNSIFNLKKILPKNRFHILIWAVMIIYLIIGPSLYAGLFEIYGKPVEFNQGLPPATQEIKFHADRLEPITYSGQDLYNLLGWSFYIGNPDQSTYDRYIVLQSESRTYFFATEIFKRPTVQEAFKDLNLNLLYSGYSTLISKDFIQPGNYHLGILFINKVNSSIYFYVSELMLIRTANHLTLEATY